MDDGMTSITIAAEDVRKIIEDELVAAGVSRLTASVYAMRILEALHQRLGSGSFDG